MSPRPEVAQSAGRVRGTPGHAALNQRLHRAVVPGLRRGWPGGDAPEHDSEEKTHPGGISRAAWAGASILALLAGAACSDLGPAGDATVGTAELVGLGLDAAAPAPVPASFYVPNGRSTVRSLRHPDPFNTLYLELRFPAGCLDSLRGLPVAPGDSILVTVEPQPGGYGFTLSPSDLVFSDPAPTAVLSFGRYADPSDGTVVFPDREAYLAALDIWAEVGVERWRVARGSGSVGVDEVGATLDGSGRFRLAAVAP